MNQPLLQSLGLGKVHHVGSVEVQALRDVTLAIHAGDFVSIVGPSGSGKSTLVNIWGLLDRPSCGQYLFEGKDVGTLDDDTRAAIRNRRIGFVFQSYNLLTRSTAVENVELPLTYTDTPADERRDRAMMALEAVGLKHRHAHWPQQLSGGEQQRVAIARALVNDPLLILADEPTGAIDRRNGREILRQLHHLHAMGRTIVLVTHDPEIARQARRIVALEDGQVRKDAILRRSTLITAPRREHEDGDSSEVRA